MKRFICFLFIFSQSLLADPKSIEVIFLSRPTSAHVLPKTSWSRALASNFECVETDEGCFHPQLGFIEKEDQKKEGDKDNKNKKEKKPKVTANEIITRDTEDSFEHDCDKNFHFDVFCGKGRKTAPPAEYEVWIDVSSSMRTVDYSKEGQFCERRYWVSELLNNCSSKIDISIFNTNKRPLALKSDLCSNTGSNDRKQIVEWLKRSKAKSVLIVTDREEYTEEFREYLDKVNAKVYGVDKESILVTGLSQIKTSFKSVCK